MGIDCSNVYFFSNTDAQMTWDRGVRDGGEGFIP